MEDQGPPKQDTVHQHIPTHDPQPLLQVGFLPRILQVAHSHQGPEVMDSLLREVIQTPFKAI